MQLKLISYSQDNYDMIVLDYQRKWEPPSALMWFMAAIFLFILGILIVYFISSNRKTKINDFKDQYMMHYQKGYRLYDIGNHINRNVPLTNQNLTQQQQMHVSQEAKLFLASCDIIAKNSLPLK